MGGHPVLHACGSKGASSRAEARPKTILVLFWLSESVHDCKILYVSRLRSRFFFENLDKLLLVQ